MPTLDRLSARESRLIIAMDLVFREVQAEDIPGLFAVRVQTRENGISEEQLASIGITPDSVAQSMASGRVKGWLCLHEARPVGFCNGDSETGEVLVLAVLPQYEGKGVGRRLLAHVTEWLLSMGCATLWLAANSDPKTRAHGFYRSLGWRPTGERARKGEEILALGLERA